MIRDRMKLNVWLQLVGLIALLVVGTMHPATADGDEDAVVKRGAAIGTSPDVALTDVVKDPDKYMGKPVILRGSVGAVCQKKGCWMEVLSGEEKTTVRVTFKDYGFFVPMDSEGMIVRAEGTFHAKTWSKEDADHLEGEGANLVRNPNGTATEYGFIATGVELMKPKPAKATPKAGTDES